MADYFTDTAVPTTRGALSSSVIRSVYTAIAAGFAKIAGYTGNAAGIVYINAGGTSQEVNANFLFKSSSKVVKLGGTAVRGTTEGTQHVDIFDGTEPVGTLADGISIYSKDGNLWAMNAAGTATQLTGDPVFSYYQAGTTAGVTIKSGAGALRGLVISPTSTSASDSTFTLYDNTAASGTVLHSSHMLPPSTDDALAPVSLDFQGAPFATGLTLVIAGGGALNITVLYE